MIQNLHAGMQTNYEFRTEGSFWPLKTNTLRKNRHEIGNEAYRGIS
ncbi:hypothetical protein [Olivibacter sp. XZL3]|nr:hypothetical protein [Olivibacter sp. XZL3]